MIMIMIADKIIITVYKFYAEKREGNKLLTPCYLWEDLKNMKL